MSNISTKGQSIFSAPMDTDYTSGMEPENLPQKESLHGDRGFAAAVAEELAKARAKHQPINSVHEGYSVILEEVCEFWDEVKKQSKERDVAAMYKELVQVAAMAQRTAEDCLR